MTIAATGSARRAAIRRGSLSVGDIDVRTRVAGRRRDAPMDERDPEEIPRDAECERRARLHPGPAAVAPPNRHDRDPVSASSREVDELDVEDDAVDALPREEVVRSDTTKAL